MWIEINDVCFVYSHRRIPYLGRLLDRYDFTGTPNTFKLFSFLKIDYDPQCIELYSSSHRFVENAKLLIGDYVTEY